MKNTDMLKGLKDMSPKADDRSTGLPRKNIDEGATRSGTAPTPRTLGPRTA
jgi:hypothetical protein